MSTLRDSIIIPSTARTIEPRGPLWAKPSPKTLVKTDINRQYRPAATETVEDMKYISENILEGVLRTVCVRSVLVQEFNTKPASNAL